MTKQEMIAQAKLACINLDIEGFRIIADYCDEMADNLEEEEYQKVQWERP